MEPLRALRPGLVERIVYRRRLLFEYWAHAACLVPASHYPAWRRAMLDYSLRSRAWGRWLRKNHRVLCAVEDAIAARGPLGSGDFEEPRASGAAGGWWNWKPSAHALDYLWMSGRILVHSRTHFRKRFDLAQRVMPEAVAREPLTREGFRRWHLQRSLHALGAAREADLRMYLTFPRAAAADQRRALRAALEAGEVVEVEVEGERDRWLALAEDLPALAAAGRRRRPAAGTTLLSPFDSFLWHRDRVRRLFGYDYKLEVYTPGHARSHGYYSLPILHDGQLVGRLDPKTHRDEKRPRGQGRPLRALVREGGSPSRRVLGSRGSRRRPRRRRRGAAIARGVRRCRGRDRRPRDAEGAVRAAWARPLARGAGSRGVPAREPFVRLRAPRPREKMPGRRTTPGG